MSEERRCWCGCADLEPFGERYLSCRDCETLVVADPGARGLGWAERGYGREYWFRHQEENQRPNLIERSHADLAERCPYWLRTILGYRLPPGRILEIGCAHGGLVALLGWAGFDAVGLETDPWVVDFARQTFDVSVLCGTVEELELEEGSLDLVLAMDVLEHLAHPLATLERCFELLRPDGMMVIQTPCRPAGKSFDELTAGDHPFTEMLLPDEHLFLFSERGIVELLQRLGAQVAFEPALFDRYDMFLVAGREPPHRRSPGEISAALASTPSGRMVGAVLELHAESEGLDTAAAQTEELRGHRDELVEQLRAAGERCEELAAHRDEAVEQLRVAGERTEKLCAHRDELVEQLRAAAEPIERLTAKLDQLRTRVNDGIRRMSSMAPLGVGDSILPTSLNVMFEGWSAPEGDGRWRWSSREIAKIVFRAADSIAAEDALVLEIEAGTYEPRVVRVGLNGVAVGDLSSESHWEPAVYRLPVPDEALEAATRQRPEARFFEVRFEIPNAVADEDGGEERRIGLCLRRLTFCAGQLEGEVEPLEIVPS